MLSQKLLDVIACTKCKGELAYDRKKNALLCSACRLRYNVRKDIPDMINAEKF